MEQEKHIKIETSGTFLPAKRDQTLTLTANPVADIFETNDAFVVALDLPGAQKETIQVIVEHGSLYVRGSVHPRLTPSGRMIHREIGWNAYERSFKLGPGIDDPKISAEFSDGVLTILLPKTEESKARQISIQ